MAEARAEQRVTTATEPERLLVSLLALGAVAALFLLRAADDNRLTSWRWAFADVPPVRLFALVLGGIVLARLAARFPLPARRPGAVLFAASCAVAALFWRAPEVIVDTSRYFTQAKHLETYGLGWFLAEWGRAIPAWTDLPLVPLLYGLVFSALGESRVFVQAFTTLLFAATAVLTFRIGRALWDEDLGFAAGALLLGIPYLLTQVPSMLVDVPSMFFFTLAVFSSLEALRRGGVRWPLLASAAVFLAIFTKYSSWLLLSVLPVMALVLRARGAPRPFRTLFLVAFASGSLAFFAMAARGEAYQEQFALLLSYQAPGLRRWGESLASTFLFQVHPFLTAAAVVSIVLAIRRRDARYAIVAWPMLLLVVLEVRRIRYLVPAFPMLALMGAYGLQALRTSEVRRFVVTCTVASSIVVALFGYLPFLETTTSANLMRAGQYLDTLEEERVEVFAPSSGDPEVNPAVTVPILDLFTAKALVYDYGGVRPSERSRAATSPLRFTWEYRNPAYYAPAPGATPRTAIVVISDDAEAPLPAALASRLEGYRLARVFAADDGVFRHRTMVQVYRTRADHG